jgi:hypothetical protein
MKKRFALVHARITKKEGFRSHCLNISVAVPGSGAFLAPGFRMGKKSGSRMNNPDHISENVETNFFLLKYFNYSMRTRDLGWKNFDPG